LLPTNGHEPSCLGGGLLTPERRSENMRAIRSKDMAPELAVRHLLHKLGYRFRLHRKNLPGKCNYADTPIVVDRGGQTTAGAE